MTGRDPMLQGEGMFHGLQHDGRRLDSRTAQQSSGAAALHWAQQASHAASGDWCLFSAVKACRTRSLTQKPVGNLRLRKYTWNASGPLLMDRLLHLCGCVVDGHMARFRCPVVANP